jgi:recombination protein RecT
MNDTTTAAESNHIPATSAQSPAQQFLAQLARKAADWQQLLPAHIDARKFASVVKIAVQRNPDLLKADRQALWQACTQAATAGLMPDGREGVIVAYGAKPTWIPMVAGVRKLVRNSGEIADWGVYVVHEGDQFKYELGDEPYIRHRPTLGDPGPMVAVYSVATFKSGEKSREVMSLAEINKARAVSKQANGPAWRDWPEEMARKTVARRHAKYLPMSTDIDAMLLKGIEAESLDDLPQSDEPPPHRGPGRPRGTGGVRARLEAAAQKPSVIPAAAVSDPIDVEPEQDYDQSTGEILEAPAPAEPTEAPASLTADDKKLLRRLHNGAAATVSDKGLDKGFAAFVADHNIDEQSAIGHAAAKIRVAHAARIAGSRSIAETDNFVNELLR